MTGVIHLVFGAAATGSLQYAFRKQRNHKIIGFPIDFSVGPIANIHEESSINYYFNWLQSSFHPLWSYFKDDQTVYQQSLQKMQQIEDGEQVTIWTCENAAEQIGLRICCYLLKDKEVELSVINTYHAMHDDTKDKNIRIDLRCTGACNPEQLAHFYKHSAYPIAKKIIGDYVQDGERLLSNKSIVRSWRRGEIVDELETRDDHFILECTRMLHRQRHNLDFINVTRVIGEMIGHAEQVLSDPLD